MPDRYRHPVAFRAVARMALVSDETVGRGRRKQTVPDAYPSASRT